MTDNTLDVQTAGRLLRLQRKQGEYWVLTLMLTGLKAQWSDCVTRQLELWKYPAGFFADQLHEALAELPAWPWADKRRKRSDVNQVPARAELRSNYQPARQLWARSRNGHYFPNPAMQLRLGAAWCRSTKRWPWTGSTAAAGGTMALNFGPRPPSPG